MSKGRSARACKVAATEYPTWDVVLIDQEPLRERVASDCTAAMSRLKRARAGWHHFERKDKPAFARWRAREFGALLSKAREVEIEIRDCQALIHEVEMEMRRGFHDAHSAYQRVMFRRSHPARHAPEEMSGANQQSADHKLSDFEQEALFQEWVKKSLGTNPDKMDDEAYWTSFDAFKSHMFSSPANEPRTRSFARRTIGKDFVRPTKTPSTPEPPEVVDARLKKLYRRLVRRLHPDARADGNAAVSALWHEVQEAYAAGDVARLEILRALSDIETRRAADQSLSQMQAVLAELERSWRALEKSLREAEGEEAWDFARIGPRADLRRRVQRQLNSDLARRTQRLDFLTKTIAEWARGPVANRVVRVAR